MEKDTILTPSMCEACILRQKKKTTCRRISYGVFIAYNVLILSVFSVYLWYINDRLDRTEKTVAVLKEQSKLQEENHPTGLSSSTTKPDVKDRPIENNRPDIRAESVIRNIDRSLSRKRRSKRRGGGKKRCKNCLPVVQIEGAGGFGKTDKSDLSNLWVTPSWLKQKDKQISKYFDVSSVTKAGKIKVKQGGLYFVYAQMNLIGPSVKGFEVFMEDENSAPECITSCKRISNLDQTENCFTMKVVSLKSNCSVYIQELETNSLSHYLRKSSFFGLVKIDDVGGFIHKRISCEKRTTKIDYSIVCKPFKC